MASIELVRFLSNPLTYIDGLRADGRDVVPFKLGNLPVASRDQARAAQGRDDQ